MSTFGVVALMMIAGQGPHLSVVAAGLKHPWSMAFVSRTEALVTEKDGQLQRMNLSDGSRVEVPGVPKDLDNVRRGDPRDNSGLFDVVLHPDFGSNRGVYLSYASKGPGGTTTKVIRGRYVQGRLNDVKTILEVLPRSVDRFHYGGWSSDRIGCSTSP